MDAPGHLLFGSAISTRAIAQRDGWVVGIPRVGRWRSRQARSTDRSVFWSGHVLAVRASRRAHPETRAPLSLVEPAETRMDWREPASGASHPASASKPCLWKTFLRRPAQCHSCGHALYLHGQVLRREFLHRQHVKPRAANLAAQPRQGRGRRQLYGRSAAGGARLLRGIRAHDRRLRS